MSCQLIHSDTIQLVTTMSEETTPSVPEVVKCEICHTNPFKYKCSKCLAKYCSLPCLNQHKEKDDCSNRLYDPLEYVSNKEMKTFDIKKEGEDNKKAEVEMNHIVKRDYEYLLGLDRQLEVAKTDFKQKNKQILPSGNPNVHNNRTVNKFLTDNGMELKFIMQRGCRCFLMPSGSSKSRRNKSRYDNKQKKFYWTVEWNISRVIEPTNQSEIITTDRCYEDMNIIDLIRYKWPKAVFQNAFNLHHLADQENTHWLTSELQEKVIKQFLEQDKLQIFIKSFPNKMNNILDTRDAVKIKDLSSTILSELLASKTCIEYPSIYLKIGDYTYVEDDATSPVEKKVIDPKGESLQFVNTELNVFETAEDIENRDKQITLEKEKVLEEARLQKEKEEAELLAKKAAEQKLLRQKRPQPAHQNQAVKKQKVALPEKINVPDFHENESEDSDDVTSEEEEETKQPSGSTSLAARLFG